MPERPATADGRNAVRATAASLLRRVVPVLRSGDAESALATSVLLIEEGFTCVEITFTIPDAVRVMERLRSERPEVVIGAGTVTTVAEVELAIDAGADFVVAPGYDPDLHAIARPHDVLYIPGALTPTEVATVRAAGLGMIKLFPAEPLGPAYLRALKGPFPDIAFVPTGGIRSSTLSDWIEAGASTLGVGGHLSSPNPDEVRHEARTIRQFLETTEWQT